MARKNRNVSKEIPNGTMLHTRDEYLSSSNGFNKNGKTKNYRKAVVVDSNRKNDLAIIKLTTSVKGKPVPGEKVSRYKPFIETKDNRGEPIRISPQFVKGRKSKHLAPKVANKMKKKAIKNRKHGKENRKVLRELKGRK